MSAANFSPIRLSSTGDQKIELPQQVVVRKVLENQCLEIVEARREALVRMKRIVEENILFKKQQMDQNPLLKYERC